MGRLHCVEHNLVCTIDEEGVCLSVRISKYAFDRRKTSTTEPVPNENCISCYARYEPASARLDRGRGLHIFANSSRFKKSCQVVFGKAGGRGLARSTQVQLSRITLQRHTLLGKEMNCRSHVPYL